MTEKDKRQGQRVDELARGTRAELIAAMDVNRRLLRQAQEDVDYFSDRWQRTVRLIAELEQEQVKLIERKESAPRRRELIEIKLREQQEVLDNWDDGKEVDKATKKARIVRELVELRDRLARGDGTVVGRIIELTKEVMG